jgi:FixJ family two-component response regulator
LPVGACAFFQKPPDNEALMATIEQALKENGVLSR